MEGIGYIIILIKNKACHYRSPLKYLSGFKLSQLPRRPNAVIIIKWN